MSNQKAPTIAERLRWNANSLRTHSTPLRDLIPLLQQAADAHDELVEALRKFRAATNTLQVAQQDGINVHGALAGFLGARDMADVAIAKATGEAA